MINTDTQVKLADQQADPNSPLYSVKDFNKLPMSVPFVRHLELCEQN
jgi:hypothetical protein